MSDTKPSVRPNKRPRIDARRERDRQRSPRSHWAERNPAADSRRFRVPRPDDLLCVGESRRTLSQPKEIGYFSKFDDGRMLFDRSKLLRYREPPLGADLLSGLESYVPKDALEPDAHPAPIAPVLAALDHFQRSPSAEKTPHFVTFRNNLNKIMGTPYNTSSEWTLRAEKQGGCVYLDVCRTESDIEGNRSMHENQKRGVYAGRQFELRCTQHDDAASGAGSGARAVNEHEEFCGLFSTTLAGKRLVVAAEIDCFDGPSPAAENYVELKTFRVLQRAKDTFVFERFKLLAFWIQSFVVGVPKIVCGFRDEAFAVSKLQTFQTAEIPSFCRKYWNPSVCLNFTSTLLDWLHAETCESQVYQVTYKPREHSVELVTLAQQPSFVDAARAEVRSEA
ncbi:hypothetical protein PybrP1_006820 [[Pythium] brassicae (nom. inval.)]|nr:hypothetical protein PybrP1_006820 [[Pythium] brassicae (nom. inval.)]